MIYRIGPLQLLVTESAKPIRVLSSSTGVVDLTPKAVRMLEVFASRPGQPLSRDDLRAAIWPTENVEDGNISRHVSLVRACLRLHLGEGEHLIRISKQGYQLTVPVTVEQARITPRLSTPVIQEISESKETGPKGPATGRQYFLAALGGLALVAVSLSWLHLRNRSEATPSDQVKLSSDLAPLAPLPPDLHPTPENRTRPSLVILDLANNSATKASDWLGTAIREVIWMDFNANEDLKVVNGQNTIDGEVDLDLPRRVYDEVWDHLSHRYR